MGEQVPEVLEKNWMCFVPPVAWGERKVQGHVTLLFHVVETLLI